MPQYHDAKQLSDKLQLSVETIRKMARAGIIPSIRLGRKCIRFDFEAVTAALANRKPGQVYSNK